jgi:hypothetical protein
MEENNTNVGPNSEDLDELVHDLASEMASRINNAGVE